ncbi:MAG: bifunctional (p)ppGpp synthetase/guanosine-3',5'-bis(diphosphate) 3'-pyrophosphohydrolase [Gammaproteobacteria bacterium]|nr:MAG: bifunctional (p)ppGpp synthetase/guanosine-3',5'-bis(diphosphate) 3'-pyrophosphohydrolase [Gammaproteobacteria bacterium]
MSDLVERARAYATRAHKRIEHRRKYSNQPYEVHLEAVAKLVASVSDDAETIAAAWLHDTVEDTPATLGDIEAQFGAAVAELVEELTDVSKPGDGNRALRKDIDRQHLAQASARAKTVKLADLIDNCSDITRHDPRFARIYLAEMGALLEVLKEGDPSLLQRAQRLHSRSMEELGLGAQPPLLEARWVGEPNPLTAVADPHFRRTFRELFTARDIAEGLLSFDADASCAEVKETLVHRRRDVASIRIKGTVQGYVSLSDLGEAACADCFRHFAPDQVVTGGSSFVDVIHVLTRHDYCFVTALGQVAGVIRRDDINKPMVRMWLFGIITIVEMGLVRLIQERFPADGWQALVSTGRLDKARAIQAERQRRNQYCELIDCLQLSDKGQILMGDAQMLKQLGFDSKAAAKRVVKELESLRNHLAHAQDIVTHDWAQIARLTRRVEEAGRD